MPVSQTGDLGPIPNVSTNLVKHLTWGEEVQLNSPENIYSSTVEHLVRETRRVGPNPTGCAVPGLLEPKGIDSDWFLESP